MICLPTRCAIIYGHLSVIYVMNTLAWLIIHTTGMTKHSFSHYHLYWQWITSRETLFPAISAFIPDRDNYTSCKVNCAITHNQHGYIKWPGSLENWKATIIGHFVNIKALPIAIKCVTEGVVILCDVETYKTRQSEMANTSIFFRDVISLLPRVFIF